jgi:hypothetical protein
MLPGKWLVYFNVEKLCNLLYNDRNQLIIDSENTASVISR